MDGVTDRRPIAVALSLITLAGFALRVWAARRESIFLDEVSLNWLVSKPFGAMRDEVTRVENTPILGFALAWLSTRLGSAPEWVRLPSLLAGTLTIPAAALLARAAFNARTGLIAAALVAASPFLNFFSVEARPYALVALFATIATLALLRATSEGAGRGWWVLWGLAAALAMLSHYTAIFAILTGAIWALAFRPAARIAVLAAGVGAGVLFGLAWWGPFTDQLAHSDQQVQFMKFLAPVTAGQFWRISATAIAGRPIVPLGDVPGIALGIVVAALTLVAVGSLARAALSRPGRSVGQALAGALRSDAGLVAIGAVVPPACLVLASLASGGSFMLARNAIAAVPCALILFAAGLGRLPGRAAPATAGLLAAGLLTATLIGTIDWPRPLMREAAAAIERNWQSGDVILEQTYSQAELNDADLSPYLPGDEARSIVIARIPRRAEAEATARKVFADAKRRKATVFVLTPTGAGAGPATPPAGSGLDLLWSRKFDGAGPLMINAWGPGERKFESGPVEGPLFCHGGGGSQPSGDAGPAPKAAAPERTQAAAPDDCP